jgi:hypothetical protein
MERLVQLPHLPIIREPSDAALRKKPGFGSVAPRQDRAAHGRELRESTQQAIERVKKTRGDLGIDPSKLLVLRLTAFDQAQVEVLERLGISVVEETREKQDKRDLFRLVVQFGDEATLDRFQQEFRAYERSETLKTELPAAMRRDLFDAMESADDITARERTGALLAKLGPPEFEPFWIDVDLWFPGDVSGSGQVEATFRELVSRRRGIMVDPIRTSTLLLTKVRGDRDLLRDLSSLDLVAKVDLPPVPVPEEAFDYLGDQPPRDLVVASPAEPAPLACVVDSGIQSGHPLLQDLVVDYRDFDSGEGTEQDLDGHGTAVAGIVALGDLARQMRQGSWEARVLVLNAKVLRRDPQAPHLDDFQPTFPDEKRAEAQLERAIRHFHTTHGCRVFNLSLGHLYRVYDGRRQQPWAEVLDSLARELDLVLVTAAGNFWPGHPEPTGQDRQQLLDSLDPAKRDGPDACRLIDPATAALALTVGAFGRRDDPQQQPRDLILSAPRGRPSYFTRRGYGVNEAAKPELSAPGGSYGLRQMAGAWRWDERNPNLGEPVPDIRPGPRVIRAACGTSFAAAHVTHACARAERILQEYLGHAPSANLIRALVVNSADYVSKPSSFRDYKTFVRANLPWLGFGQPDIESLLWSNQGRVTLMAEDAVAEHSFHVYQVQLPSEFVSSRGLRRIAVSLAYDPPTRATRQDYLATQLFVEVCRGLTAEQVFEGRRQFEKGELDEGEELPKVLTKQMLELFPAVGRPPLSRATVQHRVWSSPLGNAINKVPDGADEPTLQVFVGRRKDRFASDCKDEVQRYALVVTLSHDGENIRLYDRLRSRVRSRARATVRVRV